MNANVRILMLAKELIATEKEYFICFAVSRAYLLLFPETSIDREHPILLAIYKGLEWCPSLESWLRTNVPNFPELTSETMTLCRMAWIDKLIEEF